MSSDEISLNVLNTQLVFQDDALRSFNCQPHRVGDAGPKTRELTGFIDDKMFSADRDRYFRPQPTMFADQHPDRRDPPLARGWRGNATSPSTDETDGEDDDVDDDEDDDDVGEADKNNNHNSNSNAANCNNHSTNCSILVAAVEKMGNGKGKNGNAIQDINDGAIVTVAEADSGVYYSQYLQQGNEGSSGSGQKGCVVVDNGCGFSGSGDSLRAILSDPVT